MGVDGRGSYILRGDVGPVGNVKWGFQRRSNEVGLHGWLMRLGVCSGIMIVVGIVGKGRYGSGAMDGPRIGFVMLYSFTALVVDYPLLCRSSTSFKVLERHTTKYRMRGFPVVPLSSFSAPFMCLKVIENGKADTLLLSI